MKIILSRLELTTLLNKIQTITPSKPAFAILGTLLIEAVDDQVVISATDGTVSMRVYLSATVQKEGSIALPARQFISLVRELTAPTLEIHTPSPETAAINSGSSRFKIQGMLKAEFPEFPNLQEGVHFSIPSKELKELLSRSLFSAAKVDTQNTLNALFLEHSSIEASLCSTDGKRLTKIRFNASFPVGASGSYLIPLKAAEEIIHTLDAKEEGAVVITLMQDKIAFELNNVTLVSKLFSGKFPDVSRIIPQSKEQALSLHREELMSLLRQINLFTSEQHNSVKFSFTTGELHISINTATSGEGTVSMPVNYAGEPLHIAFNPVYFLDILRHSKDETVNFTITDSYNPGLITDSTTAQFVIMPMRLD